MVLWIIFLSILHLGLEVSLLPIFRETTKLISQMVIQVCTPSRNERAFSLLPTLPSMFCYLILGILMGIRWNLRIILICISLMTKDIECVFKCFPTIEIPIESSFSAYLYTPCCLSLSFLITSISIFRSWTILFLPFTCLTIFSCISLYVFASSFNTPPCLNVFS